MLCSKLPAPSYVSFLQFLRMPVVGFCTVPFPDACSHTFVFPYVPAELAVRRADWINRAAGRAGEICVFDLPVTDCPPFRSYDRLPAFVTDDFHSIPPSEDIKIMLRRFPDHRAVVCTVIAFFRPQIEYHANGEQVEVRQGKPHFQAPQHEQCRGYFPVAFARFFLASTSVIRFVPHNSRISGRIS